MVCIDRERARAAFLAYVDAYDASNKRIALKIAHTYRVANLCEQIARGEGMDEEDVELAWLCGLLHDLGRFEQLRLWDTFSDGASAEHAAIGAAVLRGFSSSSVPARVAPAEHPWDAPHPPAPAVGSGAIESFLQDRAFDDMVLASVECHSLLRVPQGLDNRTRMLVDIVRDADKIDILRVNCENSVQTVLGVSQREFLQSEIGSGAVRAFEERRCLAREERLYPADYLVGMALFVFELVYPASKRIMRDTGQLQRMLIHPFGVQDEFELAQTRKTWSRMAKVLAEYLEEA